MHARAGQHRTEGELSVCHIEMQLKAPPVLIVSLAVLLRAHVALTGSFSMTSNF
jgi:hypothetical protein